MQGELFINYGIIEAVDINYEPTDKEQKAIDYLFHEYDYIYQAW